MQDLGTSLQPYHTFGVAAQAKQILQVETIDELCSTWQKAQAQQLPILLLGEGSNVLFVEDFAGIVVVNRIKGIQHQQDEHYHYLQVNAGENWHQLVKYCVAQNIGGLENLALIPGCVGSAPVQNIGAYGVELKDVCEAVDVVELATGNLFRLNKTECEFAYRESVFKHRYLHGYAVVAVHFKLAKDWRPVLTYGNLSELAKEQIMPQQVFEQICLTRQSKLPDPKQIGSAGSFFKNPVISKAQFEQIYQQYPTMPHYPQADGSVKLAAGWLIDQCGLKGYQIGGAAVHEKQALVLINKANATGQDVVVLARYICNQVRDKFQVQLSPEVRFIGKQGEVTFTLK